eukprot:5354811-Prymnesium_polylepis.1
MVDGGLSVCVAHTGRPGPPLAVLQWPGARTAAFVLWRSRAQPRLSYEQVSVLCASTAICG